MGRIKGGGPDAGQGDTQDFSMSDMFRAEKTPAKKVEYVGEKDGVQIDVDLVKEGERYETIVKKQAVRQESVKKVEEKYEKTEQLQDLLKKRLSKADYVEKLKQHHLNGLLGNTQNLSEGLDEDLEILQKIYYRSGSNVSLVTKEMMRAAVEIYDDPEVKKAQKKRDALKEASYGTMPAVKAEEGLLAKLKKFFNR